MKRALASVLLLIVLLICAPSLGAANDPPRDAQVEISPYLLVSTSLPVHGEIMLRRHGADKDPALQIPLSTLSAVSVKLPAGSLWDVSGNLPGFWIPPKTLTVGLPEHTTRLALGLWPKGTISGTVKVKGKGLKAPRTLLVKTLAAPAFLRRPPVPPGAIDCPVDEKGAWSCSLPAATFDLEISGEGFIPQYRWETQVPAGKTFSLGAIVLERGASVAGWVAVEGGTIEEGRCVVRLAPLVAGGTDLRESADLERTAIERPVQRDGFFQLAGIPPGNYTVEVRQPGYSPARFSPVRITPRAATFLREPLVLTRPLDLTFAIDPPLDWLGRPWHARLLRARESARLAPVVYDGTVDAEGRFTVPGQSAGLFTVSISDSLGNRLFSDDQLRLDGPTAAAMAPIPISIKLIDIAGRLHLGDRPLAGTVWFGGQNGVVKVKMSADREGRFRGVLPRGGFWFLEVESVSPQLRMRTEVEVPANPTKTADVDIALPDTRLFGRVLDPQGKPVPHADVLVDGLGPLQHVETQDSGDFELRGLREGAALVSAASGARTSESRSVSVVEGREAGPIDLHLGQVERHNGTVLSARGPAAGARVVIQSLPGTDGGATATVGLDGGFTVELPADVHQVLAFVSAPGFPFQVFGPLDVTALTLNLSEQGGNLKVTLPGTGDDFARQNLSLFAYLNNLPLPIALLRQWALEQGEPGPAGQRSFQVPAVMPGAYRLCVVKRERLPALRSGGDPGAGAVCDAGVLSPGATLTLKP